MLFLVPVVAQGQDIDDELIQRIRTIKNPVLKPVISLSVGVLNFRGDVQDSKLSPAIGNNAAAVSVATYIDKRHLFVANFSFLSGSLSGNSYSHTDLTQNLNFRSSIFSVSTNIEYGFGPLVDIDAFIRPYVSLGVGVMGFSPKGDLVDENGRSYYYWSDGSIRDAPETNPGDAILLYRDYNYETDLRKLEQQMFGLGDYSQKAFVLPLTVGSHFRISPRIFFSLGVSYHYALTDMLDNVAYKGTSIKGRKGNDSFAYSHLSLHFDLFSNPYSSKDESMFAELEYNPLLFEDEDEDFILDIADRCPATPHGVEVDSTGCPLDGDMDGVPDYLDLEPFTERGAWVDEKGVTLFEEEFQASMEPWNNAMPREDVAEYSSIISGQYTLDTQVEIPDIFQSLDMDEDGSLSFEELLQVIDSYFDFQLDLDEVRQLYEFFFSQ